MVFPKDEVRGGFVAVVVFGVALSWSGCAEMGLPGGPVVGDPGVDAGPMVDAAPPDAIPIDAPPPWDPPDPVLPDEPCEIVSDLPEPEYDADMANYAIRFRDGQGLEASGDIRQSGLLEVENADVDKRDAVEKRLGADVLPDSRTGSTDIPAADKRAVWTRYDEVVLQTNDSIYSLRGVTPNLDWRRVGSWIQTRLRERYANTFATNVVNADHAIIGDTALVAYQTSGTDGNVAIYSPVGTRETLIPLTGSTRPRLSGEGNRLRVSYVDAARAVQSAPYVDGSGSLTFAPVGLTLAVGRLFWDVTGQQVDNGDRVSAWIGTPTNSTSAVVFTWDGATPGTATRNLALVPADVSATDDCSVTVFPVRTADGLYRVAVAQLYLSTGNQHKIYLEMLNIDPATGSVFVVDTDLTTLAPHPANFARAVAMSWEDFATLWIAVELDNGNPGTMRSVLYYRFVNGGVAVLQETHNHTAIATQGAIMTGTATNALPAPELLSPAFTEQLLGQDALNRGGWVVYAPRTREVVARSFVGYTGDVLTRATRPPKGSLVVMGDVVAWGGPARLFSEPGNGFIRGITTTAVALEAIAACYLDREQTPHEPATSDGSVIGAHAGYPRAYDGTNAPFEMDWHSIPQITAVVGVGVGGIDGTDVVTLAATWEWDDANGIRYRSAPGFFTFTQTPPNTDSSLDVTIEPFTHTERPGVRVVLWATLTNGVSLHRVAEAAVTGGVQTLNTGFLDSTNLTVVGEVLEKEQLDQADVPLGLGVVGSRPARVTDFMARAGDRLFSRDPLAGKLARFSIPSREASGFSMHWPLAFAVEEPEERDVTGALEMDGRIVLGSELGLALLTADGPDATGAGSFGLPTILRAEQGIRDQAVLARTPIGYAFGTRGGEPKLLTPGLTVEDVAKQVERVYKIEGGNIVSIAYDQNREEMLFLANAGRTLRLNTSTGRWASDPNRLGRDLTVTKDGTLYLIRSDGKVLKQREDVWADGGVGYALKVSTPWIRDMARDATTHSSFRLGAVYVSGEYLGPHDLFFDIYKDFGTTPWATFQIPEATIVSNAADPSKPGWIYGVRIGGRDSFLAARIAVRDGAEPNRTFRLAQMDVEIITDKSSQYAELPPSNYAARV